MAGCGFAFTRQASSFTNTQEAIEPMTAVKAATEVVTISAPKFRTVKFGIEGTAPYMQLRFSAKAMNAMMEKMQAGAQAKKGKAREARDFDQDYKQAMHRSTDGWLGIPAAAFRAAVISACRIVGFKMTIAKLSVFIECDGYDEVDGTPLVKIKGDPQPCNLPVRNATGVMDIRVRPIWGTWGAELRVRFDEGQFSATDIANLIERVGAQVGIGEGRPDSKNSAGLGYGLFRIVK